MSVLRREERSGGVLLLTLDRPKANVFNEELMTALSGAMREAARDRAVRAVVISGEGRIFSAGLDFNAMMATVMEGDQGRARFGGAMQQTFIDVWTCPRPTVAAVNGHAIAAGYLIAAACDFRYVVEGPGDYGLNEVSFGAGFPPIAVEIGRYVMGPALPQAILGGRLFDWREGMENGSFTHSVPSADELLDAALAHAERLGRHPQEAYAHVKAQLIDPHLRRVRDETEAHKQKTADVFKTAESARALTQVAARMLKR